MNGCTTVSHYNGDSAAWDAFVASHPAATNYHRSGWKEVIEKSFGHAAHYLWCRNDSGAVTGILPLVYMRSSLFGRYLVSLPFFNYGGLLCIDEQAEGCLIEAARGLLLDLRADHLELRHLRPLGHNMAEKRHKMTMLLQLEQNPEAQWKAFDAKLRNQVRKATKSGLTAVSGGTELLDGFYEVFSRNMRDLGTPVYAKRFFSAVLSSFPDSTRVFSVLIGDRVIASGIATWFRDVFEIPWASSIRDYRSSCPNNFLYWEGISYAIENGFSIFDFGRSTPGEGTHKFKEQWGAKPVQLYWHYSVREGRPIPELNPKNPKYRVAVAGWKRMPLPLSRLLGPLIVRNIP